MMVFVVVSLYRGEIIDVVQVFTDQDKAFEYRDKLRATGECTASVYTRVLS